MRRKNSMQIFAEEEGVPHDQDFRGMSSVCIDSSTTNPNLFPDFISI
jgi:hypothetical protein